MTTIGVVQVYFSNQIQNFKNGYSEGCFLLYKGIDTVSAHIPRRRLIKKLGFYGEILLNKTLSN